MLLAPTAAAPPASYSISLDETSPGAAHFELRLPPGGATLVLRHGSSSAPSPSCDRGSLRVDGPKWWTAPAECRRVRWTVRLADHDRDGLDAAAPVGGWSVHGRWWLLTDRLPWLSPAAEPMRQKLRITVRFKDQPARRIEEELPGPGGMPFYRILAARRPAVFRTAGFSLRLHGTMPAEAPPRVGPDLARLLGQWRRDLLPPGVRAPSSLDMIWLHPPAGAEPGAFASAGDRTLLMQFVPGAEVGPVRLRAAAYVTGAHEGLHVVLGAIPGRRPTWVEESWPTYFAWRGVRPMLDRAALEETGKLINSPGELGLIEAERAWKTGDGAQYALFYAKGTRFWEAVEAVLVSREGPSGRLGALIQDTNGFAGVDWSSTASLAAFLDARSNGRAGPIVDCYLVRRGCG